MLLGSWGLLAVASAVLCYILAGKKGRDPFLWAVVGLLLSVIGVVVLLVLEEERHVRDRGDRH